MASPSSSSCLYGGRRQAASLLLQAFEFAGCGAVSYPGHASCAGCLQLKLRQARDVRKGCTQTVFYDEAVLPSASAPLGRGADGADAMT
jgi:hypothetical protein